MATTVFFEKTLVDKKDKSRKVELEFGRSSFYGENLMYFSADGKTVIIDETTGRDLCDKLQDLAVYLGYDD